MARARTQSPDNPLYLELTGTDPVVSWILPEFIPQGALLALAGAPGAGKSFLLYTVGLALAAGIPVLGKTPAQPFRILYFDQENSRPDRVQYLRWAWEGLGRPSLPLLTENFWGAPFVLGGDNWADVAAKAIKQYVPDLFVIDTTTPACAIEDENDNAEASRAINQIRHLMTVGAPDATAIVLKHAKVRHDDGGYTLRGAKAWEGQVDGIVYLQKAQGRPRKDGLSETQLIPGKTRAFGLRTPIRVCPTWTAHRRGITLTGREE